jgi:WD40 repeat protein
VASLQLLEADLPREGHAGEVYACDYTADAGLILTAGWDGYLRLWDASSGAQVSALQAGPKPLSCCAISPDGKQWLSGSMEGLLGFHDAVTHETQFCFVAHTRPISALRFAPGGQQLATASWDRQVVLRKTGREREGRLLGTHQDIVAGCRYSADSKRLLSWSHDRTARYWDVEAGRELTALEGHDDRVTAAALSLDGRWAASGGRDGQVKLWDLADKTEVCGIRPGAEVRGCFFLLDGTSLLTADENGWLLLLAVPELEVMAELRTGLRVMCAELAPGGQQLALGGEDGRLYRVAVEGRDDVPLLVTATQGARSRPSFLDRLLKPDRTVLWGAGTVTAGRRSNDANPGRGPPLYGRPPPVGGSRPPGAGRPPLRMNARTDLPPRQIGLSRSPSDSVLSPGRP